MQQQPIAAAHHLDPVSDKATSLIFAWVTLEILFSAAEAKQNFGDGSVAFAAQARVERTQG